MKKLNYFLPIVFFSVFSCKSTSQDLQTKFSFDKKHNEISGMIWDLESENLFALEDKGNKNVLLQYHSNGDFIKEITIKDVENNDWEALTQDDNHLYIGDFGNNKNERKNLAIYQLNTDDLSTNNEAVTQQITKFSYSDQKEFPPKKGNLLFDCEAFIVKDDYFYLFTKNRSKAFDGTFYIYRIPNKAGTFIAEKLAELKTCSNYRKCAITDATLSLDQKDVLLLTHDKVIKIPFGDWNQKAMQSFELGHNSQKEALTFYDAKTLWIADESESKKEKGKLYEITWPIIENQNQN